jgi:hypothetical protein
MMYLTPSSQPRRAASIAAMRRLLGVDEDPSPNHALDDR